MTLPKNRSNSVRKVKRRAPSGEVHTLYRRRQKGKRHTCPISGKPLQAVSSLEGNLSRRRPNRKFGGQLSSGAASRIIVLATRVKEGVMKLQDIDIKLLPYVKRYLARKK
ncbi:MAG: hypothetical protein N3G22_00820 [Candidatus Micrarchaeota archaeon]|nr:hypothetical protein [Candidatus Micrarchaeota archaeon]